VREIFERGGGQADARAGSGQAGELVVVVMRLVLSDCRGKLQCILESYFGNFLESVDLCLFLKKNIYICVFGF
jgi:hypothetical protein